MTEADVSGSLRARALRGSAFTLGGYAASQLLRIGSNLVLARLLFPEAFGVMALVTVFLNGLQLISDIGLQPSIIRDERGDEPAFLDTAWTIQVARGVLLLIVGVAVAAPYAAIYGEPQLAELVPVAAFTALLLGLGSTKLISANRHLALGRLMGIEVASQAVSIASMIPIAFVYRSVWALVAGALVYNATRALLSYVAIPGRINRLGWDAPAARSILSFGKWIFLSTLVTFFANRLDVLLLGRLVPIDRLGVYSLGMILAAFPQQAMVFLTRFVLLPSLSATARAGPERLASGLESARRVLLPASVLAVLALALLAPAFFELLYDARYHDAGWMTQLLMISTWFFLLHLIATQISLALGDSRSLAGSNVCKVVFAAAGALSGFWLHGLAGFIAGLGVGSFAGYAMLAVQLSRHGVSLWRADLGYTAGAAALAAAGIAAPALLAPVVGVDPLWLGIGWSVALLAGLAVVVARRAEVFG